MTRRAMMQKDDLFPRFPKEKLARQPSWHATGVWISQGQPHQIRSRISTSQLIWILCLYFRKLPSTKNIVERRYTGFMIVTSASSDGLSGCVLGIGKKVLPALRNSARAFFLGLPRVPSWGLLGRYARNGLAALRRYSS
jgi:hypothetical protein